MTGLALFLALALLAFPDLPAAPPPAADQGVGEWLDRLASGSAAERNRAQRWLAANLRLDDYPDLAGSARGADPETARRLVHALGSDDRHLALAVLLFDEPEEEVVAVGEQAFDELVASWCPGAASQPVSRHEVLRALREVPGAELVLRPAPVRDGGGESVFETLDRLARLGGFGVPLVVAPSLADRRFEHGVLQGTPLDLLADLRVRANLSYAGVGDWSGEAPGEGAWILVTARGGARLDDGGRRLRRWCRMVESGGSQADAAARALGASAWPAALAWLEKRWVSRRDRAALEGVLAAAQRGRIASFLNSVAERRQLIGVADQMLASGTAEGRGLALRIARALARAGAMTLGGEDRSGELFNHWEELSETRRYLRLVIAEGQHSGRSDVRERLLQGVEDPRPAHPALRLQGLRALATLPERPLRSVRPAELERLVEWAISSGHGRELIVLLAGLGVEPPPEPLGGIGAFDLFSAGWYLGRGDDDEFVTLLAQRGAKADPRLDPRLPATSSWSANLARWREERGPDALEKLVARALETIRGEDRERLQALALLGGCLDGPGQKEVYRRISAELRPSGIQLELLGALCAGPTLSSAQNDLLRYLASPPGAPDRRRGLVRGLDRAIAVLVAARRDDEASELRTTVWAAAWNEDHPLHESLSLPGWPTRTAPLVIEAARLERDYPAGL